MTTAMGVKPKIKRNILSLIVGLMATALLSVPVSADQFDDQISALQSQIAADQSQINSLQKQQSDLQAQINSVNAQINQTEAQLQVLNLKQQQITSDLQSLQQKLAEDKTILDENVKTIYQQSQLSPLEVLFSSDSFSQFVDKQQYLQSVKEKITTVIDSIKATKKQLEDQQAQLATLIGAQQTQEQTLASQRAQQQALLSQNQSQQGQYQSLIAHNQQQLQAVIAARAAAIANGDLNITSGGCGGYPSRWCDAAQDSLVDNWNFFNRECVSFVAWRRWSIGRAPQPYSWGNAADWYRFVTHHSNPQPGEIAVWGAYGNAYVGGYGHVAYVESNDGSTITMSQYNFDVGSGPGRYSEMRLHAGDTMLVGVGYIP